MTSSAGPTSTANPIVAAPGTAEPTARTVAPKPPSTRVISAAVAAQLAAATPKYVPPPPKPATPPDDEPDLRDIDKPRNQIIRLPKVVVHAPPPPVFSERAINTKKGLADLAMKRYLTETDRVLNSFTIPIFGQSAQSRAMMQYEEDERLKNMAELNDDAAMVSTTDKNAGAYVKREVERTFIRPGDFDWQPMGR